MLLRTGIFIMGERTYRCEIIEEKKYPWFCLGDIIMKSQYILSFKKCMFSGSLYGKDLKEMNNSVTWNRPSSQIMFSKYHFLLKGNKIS